MCQLSSVCSVNQRGMMRRSVIIQIIIIVVVVLQRMIGTWMTLLFHMVLSHTVFSSFLIWGDTVEHGHLIARRFDS